MAELVQGPPGDVRSERFGGFHPLAVVAVVGAGLGVYKFGQYRYELLLGVLVLLGLVTLYNLVYTACGRLMRLPAEEFGVGLGGGLGAFRVGRTVVRFGWIPIGGYVKFPGQDPLDNKPRPSLRPGERYYQDVHPLQRVPFVLSAPGVLTLLGLALLVAAGKTDPLDGLKRVWASVPETGPIALSRRAGEAWLQSFSGPGGVLRGAAVTATFFGLLNLVPAPITSGGVALATLLEWLTSREFAEKWLTRLLLPLVVVVAIFVLGWLFGVAQAVFRAS
jgi:membrane-associated protease RseP (regulator of RpoE activity)